MGMVLGVSLGEKKIVAVEMVAKGSSFRVKRIAVEDPFVSNTTGKEPSAETTQEAQTKTEQESPLGKLLRLFNHCPTALALPVKGGFLREVSVPFTKEEHIRRTIRVEAERLLPAGKIEEYVFDFYRLGEEDGRSRILLVGMCAQDVKQHISKMKESGFDPIKVDVDISSAYSALRAAGFDPTDDAVSKNGKKAETKDEGYDKSPNVSRREEKVVVLAASFLGQVIVWLHKDGSILRVRSFLLTAGTAEQRAKKFERELRRTLVAASLGGAAVKRICLAGDFEEELRSEIRSRLCTEIETISLSKAFGEGLSEDQQRTLEQYGLVACGAALKLLGYDLLKLDLRQGELAYMKPFDTVKTSLSCTLTLVFFLLFITAYAYRFKSARDSVQLSTIRKKSAEYLDILLPEPGKKRISNQVDGIYQEFVERLKKRRSGERGKTATVSALDALLELGKARDSLKGGVFLLENFAIQPGKVTVEAAVDKVETGDAFYNLINNQSKMLVTDTASWNRDPKTGKIVFKYIFRVRTNYGK